MVDVDYPFELPREPLDGASLDEAKFAELPEVLQAAVENFRRATYELLVKNGLGLPGPDILTTLRTDYRLDARKLYEALNTLTIDRLMNQPVMRRHFRLATIDWFGEKKPVWKAVPTDENRVIIEKNAAAVIERERKSVRRGEPVVRRRGIGPQRQFLVVACTNTPVGVPAATSARRGQENIAAAEVPPDPHHRAGSSSLTRDTRRRVRFADDDEVFPLESDEAEPEPAEPEPEITDDYIKSLVEQKMREVKLSSLNLRVLGARLGRTNPALATFFKKDKNLLRKFLEEKCSSFVAIATVDEEVFAFFKQPSS
ncbi:hypothetical protein AAVH_03414 [Aphelenchoides avenae]|nr:hypothetical protein AAVH_03414 [Aphelenchus avenae]